MADTLLHSRSRHQPVTMKMPCPTASALSTGFGQLPLPSTDTGPSGPASRSATIGSESKPVNGQPLDKGTLKDTTQVRLGTEYLFIGNDRTIAVPGRRLLDPEPAWTRSTVHGLRVRHGLFDPPVLA